MTTVLIEIANGAQTRLAPILGSAWPISKGPTQSPPAQFVGLNAYNLSDATRSDDPSSVVGLQVHIRGTSNTAVLDAQQAVFNVLHLLAHAAFGAVSVALTWRQTSVDLALDAQGRPEIRDSYYLTGITLT